VRAAALPLVTSGTILLVLGLVARLGGLRGGADAADDLFLLASSAVVLTGIACARVGKD
jgi:hypothetical protein